MDPDNIIQPNGHLVLVNAPTVNTAATICRSHKPELVIFLDKMDVCEPARAIYSLSLCFKVTIVNKTECVGKPTL